MGWSELLGQAQTVEAFKRAIGEETLAHSIFLWGGEGVGKSLAATLLAAHWLCLSPTEEGACGECQACLLRLHQNHPDYIVIGREEGSRNIGIEAARQVGRILSMSANISSRRVIYFPEAAAFTAEAANSLLKSIEEPPPGTLFILEARNEEELLLTIRSRSQAWRVLPLLEPLMAKWLEEKQRIEPEKALLLARLSGGSLGIALKSMEEADSPRDAVLNWLGALPGWDGVDIVRAAAELDKMKKDKMPHPLISHVEESFSIFRDLLVLDETGNTVGLIHQDRIEELKKLSPIWQGAVLLEGWELLEKVKAALERNGNPRLWTEWLWIQFSQKLDKYNQVERQ